MSRYNLNIKTSYSELKITDISIDLAMLILNLFYGTILFSLRYLTLLSFNERYARLNSILRFDIYIFKGGLYILFIIKLKY